MTLAYVILIACTAFWIFATFWDRKRHWRYRWAATQRLNALQGMSDNQERFRFLKQTHHFVFEEMILTAIKRKGHKIVRNQRYTGDGGIDGRAYIRGNLFLIQAKRYKGHIRPGDVWKFSKVCRDHNARGLFIHTGKTCKKSWVLAQKGDVKMISGDRLLGLFKNPAPSKRSAVRS